MPGSFSVSQRGPVVWGVTHPSVMHLVPSAGRLCVSPPTQDTRGALGRPPRVQADEWASSRGRG